MVEMIYCQEEHKTNHLSARVTTSNEIVKSNIDRFDISKFIYSMNWQQNILAFLWYSNTNSSVKQEKEDRCKVLVHKADLLSL